MSCLEKEDKGYKVFKRFLDSVDEDDLQVGVLKYSKEDNFIESIHEANRIEILEDVINEEFSDHAEENTDWCYVLINEDCNENGSTLEVHWVGIENSENFDLNLLKRNYSYILKIYYTYCL